MSNQNSSMGGTGTATTGGGSSASFRGSAASGAGGGMMTKIPMDRLLEAKTLLECSTLVVSGLLAGSLQKAAAEILKPYRLEDELGNAIDILANATINDITEREHKPAGDGWIAVVGGQCPLPAGTLIDVRYSDGDEGYALPAHEVHEAISRDGHSCSAEDFSEHSITSIIAYRLHQQEIGTV